MSEPQFDGKCALAHSLKKGAGDIPDGRADLSVTMDGRTYYFLNPVARAIWRHTYAPKGKLVRWIILIAVIAALVWIVRSVLA